MQNIQLKKFVLSLVVVLSIPSMSLADENSSTSEDQFNQLPQELSEELEASNKEIKEVVQSATIQELQDGILEAKNDISINEMQIRVIRAFVEETNNKLDIKKEWVYKNLPILIRGCYLARALNRVSPHDEKLPIHQSAACTVADLITVDLPLYIIAKRKAVSSPRLAKAARIGIYSTIALALVQNYFSLHFSEEIQYRRQFEKKSESEKVTEFLTLLLHRQKLEMIVALSEERLKTLKK